jgi:acyl phosphate:glycerol-3-phosphate acyltransferase
LALEVGLLLVAAYLVGSVPLAFLVVKWRYGVDIRHYGTGGVGASNVFKSFSIPLGLLVFFYDIGKGILMVWLARFFGLNLAAQIAVGLAVIAGHNWPVFLRFNAGRGLATTIGVSFYLFPWGLWCFAGGAVFTLVIGSSPLPVLVGMMALPVASWAHGEPIEITLGLTAFLVMLVIRRLTAPRTHKSAEVSRRELFINRLLFDRDANNGQPWIAFRPITLKTLKAKKKG